jgi:hypothetical protein
MVVKKSDHRFWFGYPSPFCTTSSSETKMEVVVTEPTRSKFDRRKVVLYGAVAITILVAVSLSIRLKRQWLTPTEQDMLVACEFLNIKNNLKLCLEATNLGSNRPVELYVEAATIPSEIGL